MFCRNCATFHVIAYLFYRKTSLIDLLEAGIVTEETVSAIEKGQLSEDEVAYSIRQYLVGEQPIAGIVVEATGQKCGILECVRNGIIKRGTGTLSYVC